MVCIYCGNNTKVTNSRLKKADNKTWRRRFCLECSSIFTTIESVQFSGSITVEDTKKRLSPFHASRLYNDILNSTKGYDNRFEIVDYIVSTITSKILLKQKNGLIKSFEIRDLILESLADSDLTLDVLYSCCEALLEMCERDY